MIDQFTWSPSTICECITKPKETDVWLFSNPSVRFFSLERYPGQLLQSGKLKSFNLLQRTLLCCSRHFLMCWKMFTGRWFPWKAAKTSVFLSLCLFLPRKALWKGNNRDPLTMFHSPTNLFQRDGQKGQVYRAFWIHKWTAYTTELFFFSRPTASVSRSEWFRYSQTALVTLFHRCLPPTQQRLHTLSCFVLMRKKRRMQWRFRPEEH